MRQNVCTRLASAYLQQLSHEFETSESGSGCYVLTPFSRPDGETIELQLVAPKDNQVVVNDMGDSLGYLYVNGLTLSNAVLDRARRISMRFGVTFDRNVLAVHVEEQSIGDAVHRLIQATLEVTSLIQKRRPTARVYFDDEVESLIIYSGVPYDIGFQVHGQRQRHTVKFHVNSNRNLLVHPVSAAQETVAYSWAERLAYRFGDIKARSDRWRIAAVLDDRGQRAEAWTTAAKTPIEEHAVLWSEKDKLTDLISV